MKRRGPPPNGIILYEGPSAIDGKPIVAIATNLVGPSSNIKTGPMGQVFIMRSDIEPHEAARLGEDESVCGGCSARKVNDDWCYVQLHRSVLMVYRAYKKGVYPHADSSEIIASRHSIRLGSYANPSAIPIEVNIGLTEGMRQAGKRWTAYEHEWRTCDPLVSTFAMASCETIADAVEAMNEGWRPYLACKPSEVEEARAAGLVSCPYDAEDVSSPQCADCKLCDGVQGGADKRPGIVSPVHGAGYKVQNYNDMRASLRVVQ